MSSHATAEITLPADSDLVARLRAKLGQYVSRQASATSPDVQADARYKIAVLDALLTKGSVHGLTIYRQLCAQEGDDFDWNLFENAFSVVNDYCVTGGAGVINGSLPDVA